MALEDLTPFGTLPSAYQGLLSTEDTAALQKKAQIQGLLGAGLALAKGMSPYGPPRSALQNIIGAVAGGFEGAGGAYEGGLKQAMTAQDIRQKQIQIQQADLLRKEVENVMRTPEVANNPSLVALLRADPKKGLEWINENMAVTQAYSKTMPQQQTTNLSPEAQANMVTAPMDERARLFAENKILASVPGKAAREKIENNLKQIESYDKQEEIVRKQQDFTNEARRVAGYLFPNHDFSQPLNAQQSRQLNDELQKLAEAKSRAGAPKTIVDLSQRTLATERAKGVNVAEETAINASSAAADVRGIVDVLKPYKGGALQSFAANVGAYLPGTSLQQLSTANDVANSIRSRLAPTLRVAGSGATSDFESKQFLNAIPSLMQTSEGRELMATYTEKLANRAAVAADIRARMVEDGTYSIKNFQEKLKEAGVDRVFTKEEIANLTNKQTPAETKANYINPNTQNLLDKYAPRKSK